MSKNSKSSNSNDRQGVPNLPYGMSHIPMTIYSRHDEEEEYGYNEREQNRSVHSQPADAPSQIPLQGDSNCESEEDNLLWQQAESSNTHTGTRSRQLSPPARKLEEVNLPFNHLQTPYLRQPNFQFGGAGFGLVPTPISPMAWLNNRRIDYDQFTGPGRHDGRMNRHEHNRRGRRNNGTLGNGEDFNSIAYRNQQRLVAAIFGGNETLPDPRPLRIPIPGFGPDDPEFEWIDMLEGYRMRSPWGRDPNLTRVGHRAQLVASAGYTSPSRTEYGGGRMESTSTRPKIFHVKQQTDVTVSNSGSNQRITPKELHSTQIMATLHKKSPPIVLEFTLTTSPTGEFSLKVPNEKPINKGHLDLACPQIRIYNFNTKSNVCIVTESGKSRQVQGNERENVQDMVEALIRGLNLAETRLVGKVMKTDHVLAMQTSPLARLERAFGIWSECLGGQRGAPSR